jgi:hypothetical protein
MPNLYEDQGSRAENFRKDLINKVLSLVRKDTFRVLKEKLAEGKRHDSNTESTYPRGSTSVENLTAMEELTSSLWNLNVHRSDYEEEVSSSIAETSSLDEGEEFSHCEEDGGVKL